MTLAMLHYYFFKDIVDNLSSSIKSKFEYTNDLLFNISTFSDLGKFYKLFNPIRKDKYKLDELLHSDKLNDFVIECIQICKKNDDLNQLLFTYALVAHNILENRVNEFLGVRLTRRLNYEKVCNMIDYYYTKSNDNIDLTKVAITDIFPTGFMYYDYMEDLLHNPFIKIFSFFCTKEYFTKSINRKHFYYAHCTRSKMKLKLIPYKIYDWIFNHRGKPKASNYLYSKKVNTTIFNLAKKPYLVGEETYNYSLDDAIKSAYIEAKEHIDAINQFIFFDNDKLLKKLYNIGKEEKL